MYIKWLFFWYVLWMVLLVLLWSSNVTIHVWLSYYGKWENITAVGFSSLMCWCLSIVILLTIVDCWVNSDLTCWQRNFSTITALGINHAFIFHTIYFITKKGATSHHVLFLNFFIYSDISNYHRNFARMSTQNINRYSSWLNFVNLNAGCMYLYVVYVFVHLNNSKTLVSTHSSLDFQTIPQQDHGTKMDNSSIIHARILPV